MLVSKNFASSKLKLTSTLTATPPDISILPFSVELLNHRDTTVRDFARTGFDIKLVRLVQPFVFSNYIPSAILVVASWISFFIPVELVPGRYCKILRPGNLFSKRT